MCRKKIKQEVQHLPLRSNERICLLSIFSFYSINNGHQALSFSNTEVQDWKRQTYDIDFSGSVQYVMMFIHCSSSSFRRQTAGTRSQRCVSQFCPAPQKPVINQTSISAWKSRDTLIIPHTCVFSCNNLTLSCQDSSCSDLWAALDCQQTHRNKAHCIFLYLNSQLIIFIHSTGK